SDPHNIEYLRAFIRSQYRLADAESHEVDKNGNAKFFLNNIIGTVENGLLMHVWGTQRDISERKLAEEAFRQSESKYRHLIEQMNDGLMQVTPDNVILFVNKQLCDLVGYTQEELLGKVATDILTDKAGKKTVFSKLELRKKGISDQYEIQLIKKSGEHIWVRISGSPVYDRHGNVVGSIGLHTDITEQKRSEETLRASEKKFRGLFENVPDGVYQSTSEGRLLAANPALVRLLGYDTEEELCAVDSTAQFYVDPSQRQAFLLVLNRQGELRNAELVLRRKNGDIITVLENSRCIRNDEGEILYYEGTLTDITEQQSAREALKESERKYRILTEQSNDAIYLLYDGKFEVVNQKFEELFGISADEARAPGFNFLDLVAPESIPLIEERQRMVKRGEEPPLRYEFNARSRRGKLIPLEASVSYITYKGGMAVQGILRDVTERKNAEEGLKQMLSLLQSTLESTADGILLVDQSGKIVTFNRRFSQLWRIPQEVIDRGDETALVSALDQLKNPDAFVSKKNELEQKPEAESFDTIEFKDGRVFERYSIPQRAEGKVVGRVWSFRDITTRLQAEKALRESEEKYRTLFVESKDVVFISSVDGQFIDINPAGVTLFGFSTKEELMRVNIASELYFNQNDRKAFHRVIERYGFVRDFELILRRKDGEKLIVLETATAVRDDNGTITAYRGIIRDITERKRLEEQLRQAQKLQSIGTLAGGIAHDFNNILGIVLGYISRLSRDKTNIERIDQSISAITKATERGTGLVRQLLTFARQTDVTLESVNVNEVVDEIARIVQETFPKAITLSLELAQTLPSIIADSNQLHQALLNLCLNAKDAMPQGGRLTITTEVMNGERVRYRLPKALDESYVCVSISDSGTGMDEATLNRIFEPFFTTKRRGAGTGLGLAVVYGIIDSLRGFIDVYSELGRGTTFRLYFLNPQGEVIHADNTPTLRADIPGGTETILVVEDEDMLLELLKSTLEAKGYRVLTARNGVEAVDVYREQYRGIAAVITDLGLPKLGGLESSMEMMSINPKLKVVFASGYLDPNIKTELRKAPASDFIQKPYDTDEVLLRVRSLIDSPKT
ncbi:MAG TPA: PAS domain S-box protein, partial [Bacteroidota bacterium]